MATNYAITTLMQLANKIEDAKERPIIIGVETALDIRSVLASLNLNRLMIERLAKEIRDDIQINAL